MDQVGKLAEHGPLGAFAAARHSEENDRAVPMTFFHDLGPLAGVERPEYVQSVRRIEYCIPSLTCVGRRVNRRPLGKSALELAPVKPEFALLLNHLHAFKARSKPLQVTRVLLARHAETAAPDRFHGAESDIGLSALGARQAELL